MSEHLNIAPETIRDLERCFAECMDIYRRAMDAAVPIEEEGRRLQHWLRNEAYSSLMALARGSKHTSPRR
jgi:hypothetical protein